MNKLSSLPELFFSKAEKNLDKIHLLRTDPFSREIHTLKWKDTKNLILKIQSYLIDLGLQEWDRVMLVSENRPEWMAADIAIMSSKLISVPNYTTYTSRDFEHILADAKPKGLIVSNKSLFQTINTACKKINYELQFIICFDDFEIENMPNMVCLNQLPKSNTNQPSLINEITRTDPSCIIYTSGTQGLPKGVVLSHGGILSNCEGAYQLLESLKKPDLTFLTWLPLSHSYEHAVQFVQIMM